ncbi:hypothetical protein AWM68_13375 [Fictibacillus phosphorivorans]|uniref:Uncharacterized protein n=1 Tax=Fictibacillus phosphorivorans TaxID=1221500 RepID=A0A163PT63_9BACL|nr:hypothetical protein [Fictibacillus phosphorivorans]KZE64092.1 hypothetical protein AWM68_13375 [Fictibacillus phosphorivorans]
MSRPWTIEQQVYLIEAIPQYRSTIEGYESNIARKLTRSFSEKLYNNTPALRDRSIGAIEQRLPYLDNLLAGAFIKEAYAIKDQHLYQTKPRKDSSVVPNRCNTRHSYNGFLK